MARRYKRLSYADRLMLERMLKTGNSIELIANSLGVHRDTIYKEISRNGMSKKTYTAESAQRSL